MTRILIPLSIWGDTYDSLLLWWTGALGVLSVTTGDEELEHQWRREVLKAWRGGSREEEEEEEEEAAV